MAVLVALALLGVVWLARSLRPTFRCDRCGQRKPCSEYSGRGDWADWCESCAELSHREIQRR